MPPFDATDRAGFRDAGRRLVEALLAYLDADRAADRARAEADAVAMTDAFALRLREAGVRLTDAVSLFIQARRPLLAELATLGTRRALDPAALTRLYDDASALLDRLLLRLVARHDTTVSPQHEVLS